ncbi:MAG: hypothetical protein ACQEWV_28310 [Bacillota bacterium]
MGKKRHGHYCFRCERYRANEKFSGKGHRQHICKDCKRKGNSKEKLPEIKPSYNRFIKLLKVKLVAFTESSEYIFFTINTNTYVITDFDEESNHALRYIYKYNNELGPAFTLTDELNDNLYDIFEALLIKCENKYEIAVYIDEEGPNIEEDLTDYELTAKQVKYLSLVQEIESVIQKRVEEDEDILNNMFGYIE